MLKIDIESAEVQEITGVSGRTGLGYRIRKQTGWAHFPCSPHPERIEFSLQDQAPAYAVGSYLLDPSSLMIGKFNRLELGRVVLKPVNANSKAA